MSQQVQPFVSSFEEAFQALSIDLDEPTVSDVHSPTTGTNSMSLSSPAPSSSSCAVVGGLRAPYRRMVYGQLHVRVDNRPALRLYQRIGFQITSTVMNYYGAGVNAYVMQLMLPRPMVPH